eukprot:7101034-Alexandrium_andersonii.AAC.1
MFLAAQVPCPDQSHRRSFCRAASQVLPQHLHMPLSASLLQPSGGACVAMIRHPHRNGLRRAAI